MQTKMLLRSVRRLFASQPLPQPVAINLEAAPHDLFKAYTESFRAQNAKLVTALSPEETAHFEQCFAAINSLTPDEKAYFFYRYCTESDISLDELRSGLSGASNPFNPFQVEQLGATPGVGGKTNGQNKQAEAPKQQEAPKEEPKKEAKLNVDVELTGVDASKKIAIIKEIKNVLGVGLKEAKDLVEGGAAIIKKGMPVKDAEELQAKLNAIGCTNTLK